MPTPSLTALTTIDGGHSSDEDAVIVPAEVPVHEEEEDSLQRGVRAILANVLPNAFLDVDFDTVSQVLPKRVSSLVGQAQTVEQQQGDFWRQSLMNLAKPVGLPFNFDDLCGVTQMREKARSILQNHFIPGRLGRSLGLQLVLGGPARFFWTADSQSQDFWTVKVNGSWTHL
jgi:hypothetical protein